MSELQQFRDQVDDFMGHHPQSPIPQDERYEFEGLNYFGPNPDLIFEVTVERFGEDEPLVEMETTTGDVRPYRRYGRFTFTVNGTEAALTLYSDLYESDFFLPFRDTTSGKETYGAGRYLDNGRPGIQPLDETRFRFDFNYAYNPYCVYQSTYSCPLPPNENWLSVPIEAGEKKY